MGGGGNKPLHDLVSAHLLKSPSQLELSPPPPTVAIPVPYLPVTFTTTSTLSPSCECPLLLLACLTHLFIHSSPHPPVLGYHFQRCANSGTWSLVLSLLLLSELWKTLAASFAIMLCYETRVCPYSRRRQP